MIFQFKIQIRGIKKPPVWRRVLVPGNFTFDDLHRVIQVAFDWLDEHLYRFGYAPYGDDLDISIPSKGMFLQPTFDSRVLTLETFFDGYCMKNKFCYVYDFGENWVHDITLEQAVQGEREYATCIAGKSDWSEMDTFDWDDEEYGFEDDDIIPKRASKKFNLQSVNNAVMAVKPTKETKAMKPQKSVIKKPAPRHNIYPSKWMNRQPYSKQTDIDQYYMEIANRVLKVLDDEEENFSYWGIDSERREDMALALAQWFQDVVAQGGIWTTFIHECKKRYGSYLPFYHIDEKEYYDDEVNLVDVQFLVWHYIQFMHQADTVINPENFAVCNIAKEMYEIFDSEFENAPINDDWHDALHPKAFDEPLLFSFREYLYKLINCDYLYLNAYEAIAKFTENVLCNKSIRDSAQDIIHNYVTGLLFDGEENLIGLSLAEWGKEILRLENKKMANRLDTMKTLPTRLYLVSDEDKKYFHLVDYIDMQNGEDTVVYKVLKDSFGLYQSDTYKKGQSLALCRLTNCEGEWNMNGASFVMPMEVFEKNPNEIPPMYLNSTSHSRMLYEKFLEITGGKFFVFPKNKKEAIAFCEKLTGAGVLAEHSAEMGNDIVLFASPVNGIGLSSGISKWLKSDDNPGYNKEKAKENAFSIICLQNIPYEVASKMYDLGMIEDAALMSVKGYDYGRKFLQDNAQFFMDYFLQGKRNSQPLAEHTEK